MTTYFDITNRALREVNEVPLTEAQFSTARGIQQFTKDAVNRAYFDIAITSTEWPWLKSEVAREEGTEILELTQGTQWYDASPAAIEVGLHTFYLTDKDPTVTSETPADVSTSLTYITYEQWCRELRDTDNQRTTEHQGEPEYVVRHPETGKIGFSPVPDGESTYVEYLVWRSATAMSAYTDVLPLPEGFENVLMNGVRYYLWLFRENFEQASVARQDFKESLKDMKRILLSNKSERMRAV